MQLSGRHYRALIRNQSDVTAVLSAGGVFVDVCDSVADVFGHRAEDLIGRAFTGFVHPDDAEHARERFAAIIQVPDRGRIATPVRIRHGDGRWRWIDMVGCNLLDDPEVRGILVSLRDVTDRVDSDLRLRENEALHQTLTESAPVGIFRADAAGRLVVANRRLAALAGLPRERLFGSGWLTAVHPEDRPRVEAEWARCTAEERPMLIDFRFQADAGAVTSVLLQSTPLPEAEAGARGCVGTITDMTEYVRTVEALLVAEARTKAIVDTAADAILTIDEEGIVHSYNRAAEAMFGIPAAEMLWQSINRLIPMPHPGQHDGYLKNTRTDDGPRIIGRSRDIMAMRSDGSLFPIELSVSAIEVNGRRLFTGIIRDVTERKRIEAELIRAKDAAETADRAKSAFLATMSHELRTPLNAVIGFAQVIEMRLLGPEALDRYTEYATSIRQSGEHLLGIIEDILDISKIEAGALELAERPVDLTDLVAQSLNLVAMQAGKRGVAIGLDLDRDLPPVRADELRLRQILVNLLSNGVKFTDTGGRVTVGARRTPEGGIDLTVADTGVGMAPEDIPKALAAFSQVDQSMSRRYEGTGLGLPLTKRLVELHGGELLIDSVPGLGTTVTVRLAPSRVMSLNDVLPPA